MHHLRLTHPDFDFWIDVRLREFDGRWLAVADLDDTPEVGMGLTPEEALRGALAAFGPGLADQLVARAQVSLTRRALGDGLVPEGRPTLPGVAGRQS